MTIQQAKELDLVSYLSSLGYEPSKINGKSYWYLSPFRQEKEPSFKVNRNLNRWYDFAEGRGGNLVDFGTALHGCSVGALLDKLAYAKQHKNSIATSKFSQRENEEVNQVKIISVQSIQSYPLMRYLQNRKIDLETAIPFVKELHYSIRKKNYYALGFKNDAGGFEIRNENFKGSSSPKAPTFINNKAKDLAVFEGFFDLLSYKQITRGQQEPQRNFLVLNSTAFFEKNLVRMQEHERVYLYLDNDKTGQKCSQQARQLDPEKFQDECHLYEQYKDLNDWLMNMGKSQKQQLKPNV